MLLKWMDKMDSKNITSLCILEILFDNFFDNFFDMTSVCMDQVNFADSMVWTVGYTDSMVCNCA